MNANGTFYFKPFGEPDSEWREVGIGPTPIIEVPESQPGDTADLLREPPGVLTASFAISSMRFSPVMRRLLLGRQRYRKAQRLAYHLKRHPGDKRARLRMNQFRGLWEK